MQFEEATNQFQTLLSSIRQSDIEKFLVWSKQTINGVLDDLSEGDNADVVINSIREGIRQSLPLEGMTETEHIVKPTHGPNADCNPATTVHVDAFLYDEDTIDEMVEEGTMSRNYCVNCLSKQVKPLTFITHSASLPQIKFMFQYLLEDLRNKTVLDVGSRTGAVLYGAYLYSEASSVIGVELDPTFCQLQNNIIQQYDMADRIKIVHSDIMQQAELLQTSDVVILNNVFEFFMDANQQLKLWKSMSDNIRKKDTIIITIPGIEESLSRIQAPIDLGSWIRPIDISQLKEQAVLKYFKDIEDSDLDDIHMYQVL
ncbi:uncharacterized protein LOC132717851 [Ruditapes philippinarum]|uniref:uncharacterized protein LOC132717851 n=1 Tax=Ruditapes philippinarum TaxID=129788 RepID=UPI00295ACA3E|nr:uncharacterized protein LOC132717851 [Ruditapes philippinarum]